MRENDSLPALAGNALIGVLLVGWLAMSLPWVLLGYEPPVPGIEIAFPLAAGWVVWNSHRLLKP